jgi:thiol reductant ABC exporter CydC subunit
MLAIVGVRALGLIRAVLRYCERLSSHDLALRQLARMRTRFYERLAPLGPGQLRGRGRGDLLARFVSDVDTLQDTHLRIVIPALVALLVILGAAAVGWLMLPAAGVAVLCGLGATAVLSTWSSAAVAASAARRQTTIRARLTGELVEAIDGAAELAVAGRAGDHVKRLADTDAQLARLGRSDAFSGALASGLGSALTGIGLVVVLLVAIPSVRSGALPGVLLAAVAFMFLASGESVQPLPAAARRLRACTAAARRLEAVCQEVPNVVDPPAPLPLPASGSLAVEDVELRYGPGEHTVLLDACLSVAPGERVALVGPSGAGKTTLAELLVRFHDPDAGRVTLGGVDVRRLSQDDLRRAVLLCGQDAHLFNTTIRENLLIARREAREDELWDALRAVALDEWVATLPGGLDTIVGQEGEFVSGGQRQRLALARALIADCRFLILDEPTAHLDEPLARKVTENVLDRVGTRGLLVITHATDDLAGFDRVVRMDHGAVIERLPVGNY